MPFQVKGKHSTHVYFGCGSINTPTPNKLPDFAMSVLATINLTIPYCKHGFYSAIASIAALCSQKELCH